MSHQKNGVIQRLKCMRLCTEALFHTAASLYCLDPSNMKSNISHLLDKRRKLVHVNLSIKQLCNWSVTEIPLTHVSEMMYSCVGAVLEHDCVPGFK